MRLWILIVAVALSSCVSETKERDQMGSWSPTDPNRGWGPKGDASKAAPPPEEPREVPAGTEIRISPEVQSRMQDFVNRESTLVGENAEVEMSRNGWFALMTIAIAPDAVERLDQEDAERGTLTITLSRRKGIPATEDSIPTVRFGDGLRIAAFDRIVLRVSSKQSAERPFWFHAVGAGKRAVFSVTSPPQEWRGSSVDLRSDIRRQSGEYQFAWSAESKP